MKCKATRRLRRPAQEPRFVSIRWSSIAILVLWLTAMSWLVAAKIAPRYFRGDPPQATLPTSQEEPPVGWRIRYDDQWIGSSVSWVEPTLNGRSIHSRLQFDEFPLQQVLPPWLRAIGVGKGLTSSISFHFSSRVDVDADGRLERFQSEIHLDGARDVIQVAAVAVGDRIEFAVNADAVRYESSVEAPRSLSLNDELSPRARLPDLYVGRSWVQPVYSPLHAPAQPIEMLHARVERDDVLIWNGRAVPTHLVEYRREGSAALFWKRKPESRLWVDREGKVLQHEASLFGAELTFIRTAPEAAQRLLDGLQESVP